MLEFQEPVIGVQWLGVQLLGVQWRGVQWIDTHISFVMFYESFTFIHRLGVSGKSLIGSMGSSIY